ncbi:hypothetical protein [Citrobacter youngae]|uniref:hypothetical protein n=1 Tax=Citrobacter youngae TaxID=133448 RepID=UPI0039B5D73E
MKKLITLIINLLFCGYIASLCLISLLEFDLWQDKILAIIIIVGSAYIIAFIVNRFLPTKIRLMGGVLDLLSGPLLIAGVLACFSFLDPWPIKIIGTFIWIIIMLYFPSHINIDKD